MSHNNVALPLSYLYLVQIIYTRIEGGASISSIHLVVYIYLQQNPLYLTMLLEYSHTQSTLYDPIIFIPIYLILYGLVVLYPQSNLVHPLRAYKLFPWVVFS